MWRLKGNLRSNDNFQEGLSNFVYEIKPASLPRIKIVLDHSKTSMIYGGHLFSEHAKEGYTYLEFKGVY